MDAQFVLIMRLSSVLVVAAVAVVAVFAAVLVAAVAAAVAGGKLGVNAEFFKKGSLGNPFFWRCWRFEFQEQEAWLLFESDHAIEQRPHCGSSGDCGGFRCGDRTSKDHW